MINIKKFENFNDTRINEELTQAIYYGMINNVKNIIDNFNPDINYKTDLNNTLLHVSAFSLKKPLSNLEYKREKSYEILKMIIDAGAYWNIKNKSNLYFVDILPEDIKQKLINDYPEKYENFLIQKESDKYNL